MWSKWFIVSFVLLISIGSSTFASSSQLSQAQQYFLQPYEQRIDHLVVTLPRTSLTTLLAKLQEAQLSFARSSSEAQLLDALAKYLLSKLPGAEVLSETPPLPPPPVIPIFSDAELSGIQTFVATRQPLVTSSMEFAQACKDHYARIDALAREQNFPTALIIATWWREYSCNMSNPANGRGIFQITSHYYEPWPLSEAWLLDQVQHFIDFARAKRKYHDNVQPFDDTGAIQLSYLHYDLLSIQKHSIMYNGVKADATPENSVYANQNFGIPVEGRDGIVAMVIKVLSWWLAEQEKQE